MSQPKAKGGVAGIVLVCCLAASLLGLILDFTQQAPAAFWIAARPGGGALIGAIAAIFCIVAAFVGGVLLGRGPEDADA